MALKKIDLNKKCFFILSGVRNVLSNSLAVEMCRRLKNGSKALLIEDSVEHMHEIRKSIQILNKDIDVICIGINGWESVADRDFLNIIWSALDDHEAFKFQLVLAIHNEGIAATNSLIEPQEVEHWKTYLAENLYAPVALNQAILNYPKWGLKIEKFIINIKSSLMVKPFHCHNLICSSKRAREMYFRAVANEHKDAIVLNFSPGIFETHCSEIDINNNKVDLFDMNIDEDIIKLHRVKPLESTLKLINILEELAFISGHDVDYYDTYVL